LNELLLVERINELHRKHYASGGVPEPYLSDPNNDIKELGYLGPTLRMAGQFSVELSGQGAIPGSLKISARSHGPTSFGYAKYVSAETLAQMTPHLEAGLWDNIWREGMHSLAKELRRLREAA
jgi:hypothetical protein